jgi:peptidoglycan/xylan/chitin deacetylase (PgdA/CDA1 family)
MAVRTPSPDRWPAPPFVAASIGLHVAATGAVVAWPAAWPWALAAVGANHAAIGLGGLWPRSRWLGPNVTRLPAEAGAAIALTFDDGPDPEVTPALLDLLDALRVRATFFCIAERARRAPALVRDIRRRGHAIGNHTDRHRHDFALRGPRALAREVGDAQSLLADLAGTAPRVFRAPAGLRNPFLDPVLHRLGLHLVSWTRRAYDTRSADAVDVEARLVRGLSGGDILLLHDGNARRAASGRAVPLDVVPGLVARCRAAGLTPVTLDEALPARGATVPPSAAAVAAR